MLPFIQHLHDVYDTDPHFPPCRVRRAAYIRNFFDEYSGTQLQLEWPAKSPDLNIIGNI